MHILTLLTLSLASLIPRTLSQGPNLCANMVFSARFDDLFAPSLQLLQLQCSNLCASARNSGINTFGRCALGGVSDIEVQLSNIVRYARCQERCTGQTAFEGDCGCTVSANDVLVVQDEDILEECDATVLVNGVFREAGWTAKIGTESSARACPSGQPPANLLDAGQQIDPLLNAGQQPNSLLNAGQQPDSLLMAGQQPDPLLNAGQQPAAPQPAPLF